MNDDDSWRRCPGRRDAVTVFIRCFLTGTHHHQGFAALVPGKGDDTSLRLQDDLRDAPGLLAVGEDAVVPGCAQNPWAGCWRKQQ